MSARADVLQHAAVAVRAARRAGLAPVGGSTGGSPAPRARAARARSRSCSVLSGSFSCVLGEERQPVRDAVDVRVHRDALDDAKPHVHHDVGRLAPHAGQARELPPSCAAPRRQTPRRSSARTPRSASPWTCRSPGCGCTPQSPRARPRPWPPAWESARRAPASPCLPARPWSARRAVPQSSDETGLRGSRKHSTGPYFSSRAAAHLNGALDLGPLGLSWHVSSLV